MLSLAFFLTIFSVIFFSTLRAHQKQKNSFTLYRLEPYGAGGEHYTIHTNRPPLEVTAGDQPRRVTVVASSRCNVSPRLLSTKLQFLGCYFRPRQHMDQESSSRRRTYSASTPREVWRLAPLVHRWAN